ncbi:hypothetical protein [Diaphorobacter sp.]|uniref:hypothetical protein n=1 Tax=Diaphorobacter sp. TaxID=1934310 RepID=UPI00258BC8D6|nr:hypothetical protein [Diaphorobacter sp.]
MSYDTILPQLKSLRRAAARPDITRAHRADCPCCGGKLTLSTAEGADSGAVLLHCFKGCGAGDIAQALGLDLADLFPVSAAKGGGFVGPRGWLSAAAAGQEVEDAAFAILTRQGDPAAAYGRLHEALQAFKAAARDAMRGSGRVSA